MPDSRAFYINGEWVPPVRERNFDVVDPATEQTVATISLGDGDDVDRAVAAAQAAFPVWSDTPVGERILLLEWLRDIYLDHTEAVAQAMTLEMGTPITFSRDVQAPCGDGHIQAVIDAVRSHRFERPSDRGGSMLRDEPVGVCGLITPWNWPVNQVIVKVVPALAAGCTVVLKPSEQAPLSALLIAEMIHEAGFPSGTFNLVNGDGPGTGAPLAAHPGVEMVSFTGSTAAGIAVSAAAAPTIKRVALELGGKSPNLLFADCDLDTAVPESVRSCMSNSGQSCDAPTRLLVESAVYDEVVERAQAVAEAIEIDDPKRPGDHLGPVVSARQWERVQQMIAVGMEEATLVAGGPGRPPGLDRGFYVRPTVFAGVTNDMRISREEIFGPVLCILGFDSEAEAVAIANDTAYGLSAFIQTGDGERAHRVARKLRVGQVNVNGAVADYDVPFGGVKQSGNGRENGAYGLTEYLEVKSITG